MKYNILIVTGGGVDEREISIKTAENVLFYLKKIGHKVEVIDVEQVNLVNYFINMIEKPDLVFNCLHGKFGEDGQVQAIFEWFGLRYTHSNCVASAVAMNKKISYHLAESIGVVCPLSHFLSFEEYQQKEYTGRHILKPIDNGSSVGVHLIDSSEKKRSIKKHGEEVMMQDYIPGIEVTVTVLSGSAINCMEIDFSNDIFSEECKYNGMSKYRLFNNETVREMVFSWSEKMHNLIGCSGVTRSDFRYDPSVPSNRGVYYLETNTQPGLSKYSIIPKMFSLMGMDFENFLEIMISDVMNKDVDNCGNNNPKNINKNFNENWKNI